jgi:hypothetical protein
MSGQPQPGPAGGSGQSPPSPQATGPDQGTEAGEQAAPADGGGDQAGPVPEGYEPL